MTGKVIVSYLKSYDRSFKKLDRHIQEQTIAALDAFLDFIETRQKPGGGFVACLESKNMNNELRRHARLPYTITIDLYTPGSAISKGRGCITNISIGGVAIESEANIDLNTQLIMHINIPIEIYGKVVRTKFANPVNSYGISFTKMRILDKIRLQQYLALRTKTV